MTWQRAGLAAVVAFALTLVTTAPHVATLAIACIAFCAISRLLDGRAVLDGGTPITWRSGFPVAAVLLGLTLVDLWPHAVTLGIGAAIFQAIGARLDSSA